MHRCKSQVCQTSASQQQRDADEVLVLTSSYNHPLGSLGVHGQSFSIKTCRDTITLSQHVFICTITCHQQHDGYYKKGHGNYFLITSQSQKIVDLTQNSDFYLINLK